MFIYGRAVCACADYSIPAVQCSAACMASQPSWDAGIQQLLQDGTINGYALLSKQGSTQAAKGLLSSSGRAGCSESGFSANGEHIQLRQFAKAFSDNSAVPLAFQVAGQRAVVFRRTDCDILAISRRRRLGLCIYALPFGILVASYGRAKLPQEVVPRMLQICDMLRS